MSFSSPIARSLHESQGRAASPAIGRAAPTTPQQAGSASTPTRLSSFPSPLPATPTSAAQTPTGRWSHPVVSLIPELQRKNAPNDSTIRKILLNAFALFAIYKASVYIDMVARLLSMDLRLMMYIRYGLYALLTYNVAENVRRFGWTLSDAAAQSYSLTEAQRKQLNLPTSPASTASIAANKILSAGTPTPHRQNLTPPKYQKQSTPSPSASRIVLDATESGTQSSQSRRRSSLSSDGSTDRRPASPGGVFRQSPLGRQAEGRSISLQPNTASGSPLAIGRW
ncbi:hypothetical protein BCR37DRAFT_396166 [Protomyces lactucae-debilis]|uniref:Nuclear pore complex component-domain-containing protein n=1 Tax=Protomyces lactucae-debilis TaxID=2754530 RepID=A0A1Y2FYG8_PROLT|nr:uncharacterized protein BCR37DRAFT_396166 [Protomyces lactucae-debilis]ORY87725.1 hypothetical protein BCR37DRAFT_396166 [Protomyces lactucae-debilis]